MESIKILHCADLHLDAPMSGFPNHIAEIRQEELRETFGKIVNTAEKEKVDVCIISGDFFDRETVKKTTIDYIIKKLKEIEHIIVVIAPGNHDCLSKNTYYSKQIWPRNVHIFGSSISRVDFPQKNLSIYGIGFNKVYHEEGLLKGFSVEDKSRLNIMAIHGEINTSGTNSPYNPISLSEIENSGLDYIALGHVHTFSGINKVASTYWCYPGTPEGKGFDEKGKKGVVIGEVSKAFCQLEFIPLCKREYREIEVDISGIDTYEEITNKVKDHLGENSKDHFCKIILVGEISEDFNIHSEVIKSKLEESVYFLKVINETSFIIDLEQGLSDDTLKNVFINNMREKIEAAQDEDKVRIYKRALKIGICALNGERIDFNENI